MPKALEKFKFGSVKSNYNLMKKLRKAVAKETYVVVD